MFREIEEGRELKYFAASFTKKLAKAQGGGKTIFGGGRNAPKNPAVMYIHASYRVVVCVLNLKRVVL